MTSLLWRGRLVIQMMTHYDIIIMESGLDHSRLFNQVIKRKEKKRKGKRKYKLSNHVTKGKEKKRKEKE